MSRPKPGIGRELRRTLGHAKGHSVTSGNNAIQLVPVVSHYVTGSRSTHASTSTSTFASTSTTASSFSGDTSSSSGSYGAHISQTPTGQFSHLPLTPVWDTLDHPSQLRDNYNSNIVLPYRPQRRIPLTQHTNQSSRTANLLAPRPIRLGETLLRRVDNRTYTSSTAPVHHAAMDLQSPFPSLSIPPSILADKFDLPSNTNYLSGFTSNSNQFSTWPFDFLWSSQQPPTEQEVGLATQQHQQPPSPGPGTVKTRELLETHTVLSPSTPAPQQSSSPSHALLTQYALILPDSQVTQSVPNVPDSGTLSTYSSSLEFRIGASGLAKIRAPPPAPRPSSSSSSSRERSPLRRSFPLPEVTTPSTLASEQVGEDAYFTRPDSMCIADGVGGWASSGKGGANAARWSRLLTHFVREEIDLWWKGDPIYTESGSSGKVGGKGKKSWSDAWREAKTKEDDGTGLEPGMTRRKLDAVEIMQRGFEKCLSCVLSEVSINPKITVSYLR